MLETILTLAEKAVLQISAILGISPEITLIGLVFFAVVILPFIRMLLGLSQDNTHSQRYL